VNEIQNRTETSLRSNMTIQPMDLNRGGTSPAARAGDVSLPEVHRSVAIPRGAGWLGRFLAFAGPGYLVSVGYMDPGNWGTDIAGGARYGYALLWVVLASNLMAILLQTLCARLGIVTGKDLAQACRDYYKKPAAIALWLLCEIAIIACDLAEVIGSAVALNLLFGIPLLAGVLITGLDVLLLLGLMRFGFRKIEAIVVTLIGTIAACFALQVVQAQPEWGGVVHGLFVPSLPDKDALFIALGILGATVMPHNLYLHSSIVQTRAYERTPQGLRQAIRGSTADTIVALSMAFFVNAAILVVAAAVFHATGRYDVTELRDAHELLQPLLGGAAATAFAVALLCSGQSSTITGTLAGQIVMEGFLKIRIAPWLRRLITRGLAIIPAMILIAASGGRNTVDLLILSQVVLSMQLSFAIFPLMIFTSDPRRMGEHTNPLWLKVLGYAVCVVIAALNLKLLYDAIGLWWCGLGAAAMLGFSAYVKYFYRERATMQGVTTV
jgi:manganese transport protein